MRLARLSGGLAVLVASAALAAQGDPLLVSGSNVNVRAGPSTEAGILVRVGEGELAIERRRQGEWVEVELPDQNVLGWIHASLLTVDPAQSLVQQGADQQPRVTDAGGDVAALNPAATDAAELDESPLGKFRREVEYFNDRAVAAAGVDLFTAVASLGEGGVQVVTTEVWATMAEPGQQNYLNALFARWRAAAGADQALRLEIVDPNGALMMEKSGP